MPKIPGSAVWVDGGSFAELENVGGRAGSRRGAVDGFGFEKIGVFPLQDFSKFKAAQAA